MISLGLGLCFSTSCNWLNKRLQEEEPFWSFTQSEAPSLNPTDQKHKSYYHCGIICLTQVFSLMCLSVVDRQSTCQTNFFLKFELKEIRHYRYHGIWGKCWDQAPKPTVLVFRKYLLSVVQYKCWVVSFVLWNVPKFSSSDPKIFGMPYQIFPHTLWFRHLIYRPALSIEVKVKYSFWLSDRTKIWLQFRDPWESFQKALGACISQGSLPFLCIF